VVDQELASNKFARFAYKICTLVPCHMLIYLLKFEASVRLCAPWSHRALTLYPATDCAAATDISGVSSRWQLSC